MEVQKEMEKEEIDPFNPQFPIPPSLFYDREEIIERFIENVQQGTRGKVINMGIVGEFGIGKTSLLRKLYSLEDVGEGDYRKAFITLKEEYLNSFEGLMGKIYHSISRPSEQWKDKFKVKEIDFKFIKLEQKENLPKDIFLETMARLWESINPSLFVIFIDDFHLAMDYFIDIRNFFQELHERGCKFMLVVTMLPEVLRYGEIDDPFKRFFEWEEIGRFSKQDSINMIRYVAQKSKIDLHFDKSCLDTIYDLTSGHPYYIFLLLDEILRGKRKGIVTIKDLKNKLPRVRKRLSILFQFQSLDKKEKMVLQKIVSSRLDVFSPSQINLSRDRNILKSLEERGLIEKVGYGKYRLKHPICRIIFYENYFTGDWVVDG